MTSLKISNGVSVIGNGAFDCCESLVSVEIPDSIEWIYPNAFKNSKNITIKGASGSKAEEHAKEYGIKFETLR